MTMSERVEVLIDVIQDSLDEIRLINEDIVQEERVKKEQLYNSDYTE